MKVRRFASVLAISLISTLTFLGCGTDEDGIAFEDPEVHRRFKEAMSAEGVPFRAVRDNELEFIFWDRRYSKTAERLKQEALGSDLRSEYNIALAPEKQVQLEEALQRRGIPYKKITLGKREVVYWDAAQNAAIEAEVERILPGWAQGKREYYEGKNAP